MPGYCWGMRGLLGMAAVCGGLLAVIYIFRVPIKGRADHYRCGGCTADLPPWSLASLAVLQIKSNEPN